MTFDDPNREAVGLDPIWTTETEPVRAAEPPEPEAADEPQTAKSKAAKKS